MGYLFGCNGYVTAMAAGQSQSFILKWVILIINDTKPPTHRASVGIFNWYYLSSTPRDLHRRGVYLELTPLIYYLQYR
jgi:hypothetical protein